MYILYWRRLIKERNFEQNLTLNDHRHLRNLQNSHLIISKPQSHFSWKDFALLRIFLIELSSSKILQRNDYSQNKKINLKFKLKKRRTNNFLSRFRYFGLSWSWFSSLALKINIIFSLTVDVWQWIFRSAYTYFKYKHFEEICLFSDLFQILISNEILGSFRTFSKLTSSPKNSIPSLTLTRTSLKKSFEEFSWTGNGFIYVNEFLR